MAAVDSIRGRTVLTIAHVAGMVDMVALPIWVGTLVVSYKFDPQQSGGLVTLFLMAVVLASVLMAPRFDRMPRRWMTTIGFAVATVAFFATSKTSDFSTLGILHFIGGLGVGCGLSFTHGSMGRSSNPHRLFAMAQFAVGAFAVMFFGGVPNLIAANGGQALFLVFGVLMFIAVIATGLAFPVGEMRSAELQAHHGASSIPKTAWFAIFGVLLLALNQAMMFSFVERIGMEHNFGQDRVNLVLVIAGFITLLPAIIAAALQKTISAQSVGIIAPLAQAALALTITQTRSYEIFEAAVGLYVFVMIFSHVFLFGLIARLDLSGRAVASTPAMVMTGSAIGPFLGGTLVVNFGYTAIGYAVVVIGVIAVLFLSRIKEHSIQTNQASATLA